MCLLGLMAGAAEAGKQGPVGKSRLGHQVKSGFSLVGNREPWKVLEEENPIITSGHPVWRGFWAHLSPFRSWALG